MIDYEHVLQAWLEHTFTCIWPEVYGEIPIMYLFASI